MIDNDNAATGKVAWTEHELLVCILNTIERNNIKLDFSNAPVPPGRNANGLRQKVLALKKALKPEMDAINAGLPMPDPSASPKKGGSRKRKVQDDEDEDDLGKSTKKKYGRTKKQAANESRVKDEPEAEVEDREVFEGEV